jgi:hypothetical protein
VTNAKDPINEAEVEQLILFPLLTNQSPYGFGYSPHEVRPKASVPRLVIDKRKKSHVWFPDFLLFVRNLPFAVVEAKPPGDNIEEAAREARMYASELNSAYPTGLNPCNWIIVSDGIEVLVTNADSVATKFRLPVGRLIATDIAFSAMQKSLCREAADEHFKLIYANFYPASCDNAISQYEESIVDSLMPPNTFGKSLRIDFGRLFDPEEREDRKLIARKAFVASNTKKSIVDPIDRLLRAAMPPSVANAQRITNPSKPRELLDRLEKELSNQKNDDALGRGPRLRRSVILLVGARGSGKSTFADYLEEVALSDAVRNATIWCRLDLNKAPNDRRLLEGFILQRIRNFFELEVGKLDRDQVRVLLRKELKAIEPALEMLPVDSPRRDEIIANTVLESLKNDLTMCKAYERLLCGNGERTFVVVFDNCDKREKADQLLLFESARWIKDELEACVFLPIRDITYDLHQNEPPLDTATSSNLVFRIDAPDFISVLERRIALAIESAENGPRVRTYTLEGGLPVEYDAKEQTAYLRAILRALYVHDEAVKRLVYGIAGRDVRRALNLFIDFCESGHFSEQEALKLRKATDHDRIEFWRVVRILARGHHRFYKGDRSSIKNLFQTCESHGSPNHFLRIDILEWLSSRVKTRGPFGKEGFFRACDIAADLEKNGYAIGSVLAEVKYLVSSLCILSDKQSGDELSERDVLRIGPAGEAHLSLLDSVEYIAACSEETLLWNTYTLDGIRQLLTLDEVMFSPRSVVSRAKLFCDYLVSVDPLKIGSLDGLSDDISEHKGFLSTLRDAIDGLGERVGFTGSKLHFGTWVGRTTPDCIKEIIHDLHVFPNHLFVRLRTRKHDGKSFAIVDTDAATASDLLQKSSGKTYLINGQPISIRRFIE